jgi:NIPSNAP
VIVEERVYTMMPGGVARYVELWNQFGREAQIECLGDPLGVYSCEVGELNTLTYLWEYESMQDRAARRTRLHRDERFTAFRAKVRDLVVQQRNRILVPVRDKTGTRGGGHDAGDV